MAENNNLTPLQRAQANKTTKTYVLQVEVLPNQSEEHLETLKLISQNCTPEELKFLKLLVSDPKKKAKAMSYASWL